MSKDVEIACEVRAQTTLAMQIYDGKTTCWIPKSQISDESEEDGNVTSIFIPEWLAIEKGLV